MLSIRKYLSAFKTKLPWPIFFTVKKFRGLREDLPILVSFLIHKTKIKTTPFDRLKIILKCYQISYFVDCPHMESEIIAVIKLILSSEHLEKGVIVECGSYKGGSSAKLSLAAHIAKRKLFIFDSFEGLPENDEKHGKNIFGGEANFPAGSYFGSLEEVKNNIKKFGKIEACEFIKGWFKDTLSDFFEQIEVAFIDVDLVSSTRTCIKYLYPLLRPGGVIFSQDGHLPLIIKLLKDKNFWQNEIGIAPPRMIGLGERKLVEILKN